MKIWKAYKRVVKGLKCQENINHTQPAAKHHLGLWGVLGRVRRLQQGIKQRGIEKRGGRKEKKQNQPTISIKHNIHRSMGDQTIHKCPYIQHIIFEGGKVNMHIDKT
jgi:hypothetical protein